MLVIVKDEATATGQTKNFQNKEKRDVGTDHFSHRGLREKQKRWRNGLSSAPEN
jgi:hypothetical protein